MNLSYRECDIMVKEHFREANKEVTENMIMSEDEEDESDERDKSDLEDESDEEDDSDEDDSGSDEERSDRDMFSEDEDIEVKTFLAFKDIKVLVEEENEIPEIVKKSRYY